MLIVKLLYLISSKIKYQVKFVISSKIKNLSFGCNYIVSFFVIKIKIVFKKKSITKLNECI